MSRKAIYKDKKTAYKAKLRYINNHNKENYRPITIRFFKDKDKDILDFIDSIEHKADYFRNLIREQIKKSS